MSIGLNGANGVIAEATYSAPSEPRSSIHYEVGAYAKNPDVTVLKSISIRLAYRTPDELLGATQDDTREAMREAVMGLRAAGVTIPADLMAAFPVGGNEVDA